MTYRDSLQVNRIYRERKSDQYFFTPDGIGCIWYPTCREAREDTGITSTVITINELSDF